MSKSSIHIRLFTSLAVGAVWAWAPMVSASPATVLTSCLALGAQDEGAAANQVPSPEIPAHDPADEQDLGDGLIAVDLVEGEGSEIVPQSLVIVDYTGWLADDGSVFDSTSPEDRDPFVTSIPGRLIEGWNRGMLGMRAGGVRKLIIPSELAYGAKGAGKIPPDADLVFEVKALEVLQPPKVDESKATVLEDGSLYQDVEVGSGDKLEENGFGHVHLIVWDGNGEYRGSTRGSEPLLVRTNQQRYWVPFTIGMNEGGHRIAELDDPTPQPLRPPGAESEGEGGADEEADEPSRWTLWLEMVDVVPPITMTPHDPADEQELNDGLIIVQLKKGEGEELPEHAIPVINYSAWLEDGTLVDSTFIPGNEPVFASPGLVIKGWEEGLKGMKVGGKRKLIIPPGLAFGDGGNNRLGIPPDATLIYEVEIERYEMPLFLPVDDGEGGGLFNLGEGWEETDKSDKDNEDNGGG